MDMSTAAHYDYTDLAGTELSGTLAEIGSMLIDGKHVVIDGRQFTTYHGYGLGRLTDNPEPWLTYVETGDPLPRECGEDEWIAWASRVEDRPESEVKASLRRRVGAQD